MLWYGNVYIEVTLPIYSMQLHCMEHLAKQEGER